MARSGSKVDAASGLQPILAAVASSGALVLSSLSRAVHMAAAKRLLKAKPVCSGLEGLLQTFAGEADSPTRDHVILGAWHLMIEVSSQVGQYFS